MSKRRRKTGANPDFKQNNTVTENTEVVADEAVVTNESEEAGEEPVNGDTQDNTNSEDFASGEVDDSKTEEDSFENETSKSDNTSAETGSKKAKKRLGIIFLKEDEENGLEKKLVEPDKVQKVTELAIAVFVALAMAAIMMGIRFVALDRTVKKLNTVIEEMSSQNSADILALTRENAELSEKVSLLSNQVAVQMVVDEENEAKKVPVGLPISGKVQVISEPETEALKKQEAGDNLNGEVTDEEDEIVEPIVVFGVEEGSKVMASGNGTVTYVGLDDQYLFRVEVNHGNGYTSVYRYAGAPIVKEGDEVLKAQMLFSESADAKVVGYQIIKDEEFIDPMTVMEING